MITQRLLTPFWRRRWLILTITLTVLVGSLFWAQGLPHVYASSVTLVAESKDGKSIPPGQLARLRREVWSDAVLYPVVESDAFNDRRASGTSNEVLVEQVRRSMDFREHSHGTSAVIHLRYLDLTPERAEKVAGVLGQTIETAEAQNTSQGSVAFRVQQPPSPASGPIKPQQFVVGVKALGGGLLLGLVLAGLSEIIGSWRHRRHRHVEAPIV
jgi:capsular polysaccharide biosynthesis protein